MSGNQSTVITKKDMLTMDRTSSSIKGVLDNLRVQLQMVEDDIKASEKSRQEFSRILAKVENRRAELAERVERTNAWAAKYDLEVGPFAARYSEMTGQIGVIYDKAKVGHAKGIVLLEKEFGYHPAFKHPGDTFTAIPFRPL